MSSHLSSKNSHIRDSRIVLTKDHVYYIDGKCKNVVSTTKLIYKYFKKFDEKAIIKRITNSYKWKNDPTYKYYKMKAKDIKKLWKEGGKKAANSGTSFHEKVEMFYNDIEIPLYEDEDNTDFELFLKFYEDHEHLDIYRTEWSVFAEDIKLAGTIDAIFINDDGSLSLYDWKRCKEIRKTSYNDDYAKYPFNKLPDCNFSQYSIQLNIYKVILEKYYGFVVKDMFLVVCHPDNENYVKIEVTSIDGEIQLLFDDRLKLLSNP